MFGHEFKGSKNWMKNRAFIGAAQPYLPDCCFGLVYVYFAQYYCCPINSRGVIPYCFLKANEKWERFSNPTS